MRGSQPSQALVPVSRGRYGVDFVHSASSLWLDASQLS